MQDRERILELVKKGVLSTEEALVLLESLATQKDEQLINHEAAQVNKNTVVPDENITIKNDTAAVHDNEEDEQITEAQQTDQERLEEILENLANEANQTSSDLDEVTFKIQELNSDVREKKEAIMVIETMEELDSLTESKAIEKEHLENELTYLIQTIEELEKEKERLSNELKDLKRHQKMSAKEDWKNKFDIPEDWKEQANETFTNVSGKVEEVGSQFGQFLKKTIDAVTTSVNDNVDWKDINIKVPGVASQSFSHEFFYPSNEATLIDIKVANGNVSLKNWDEADVKVEADIKFYGKVPGDSLFEAFLERSEIEVDDETISFQIPNKRIKIDLVFYLPTRLYDHVSVKMLNGDIDINNLEIGDAFLKSTNGDMTMEQVFATMVETEGVNGDITVKNSQIVDLMAETVNGDVTTQATIHSINVGLINGDIKMTSKNTSLKKVKVNAVNGTIKLALPSTSSLEGTCQTNFGSIKNRLNDVEIVREKSDKMNQSLEFRRQLETEPIVVELSTTTGSLYLKDSE